MKHHLCALALFSLSTAAFADEAQQVRKIQELPTTVVTGELWESELQNTTASVTVLGGEALDNNGVQHFEDVINAIPNLTWTGGTSRPRYLQIRGIGENSQYEGETPDSSVRFLIDDLDLTGLGTVGNLFDVQQVEVLRGPQAGAFGANAAGGVVRIVTKDPTPHWTGQTEASVGNDELRAGGIAVGGPLLKNDPEQVTFRLALHKLVQNGFRENVFLVRDDTNERDELTTRLKLRWLPSVNWKIDGQFFYADIDNGFDEFTLTNDRTDTYSDQPGRDEQESFGTSWKAGWTGETIELVSTTSYIGTDSLYSFDGDWTNPTRPLHTYTGFLEIERDRDVVSQDIRINSVDQQDALGFIDRWTTGMYYESLQENTVTTGFGDFETDYASETVSLYGQAPHEFGEGTRLTLGLRVESYDLDTEMDFREDAGFEDTLVGGKLTFEHDLNPAHTAFASIARGYKAGGVNIYPFIDPALPVTYDTEYLWNYELGLRSTWFDGAVLSQITFFYLDRDDTQVRGSSGSGISYSYFTVNGDSAEHYGAEAEATWFMNEQFTLHLTGGILQTERDGFAVSGAPSVFYESGDVSNAPAYTCSARLDYEAGNGIFASAEVVGSDEYFESDDPDQRDQRKRNAFAVVNASVGYRYENWTFTLWSKNLFDEEYEDRAFFFDNGQGEQRYETPAAPRTFGVTANYSW
jgi:outer membrane receptor protein involved in Fe transport